MDDSERKRFEAWCRQAYRLPELLAKDKGGHYANIYTAVWWKIWLARAALDRGLPPLVEVPEGETSP